MQNYLHSFLCTLPKKLAYRVRWLVEDFKFNCHTQDLGLKVKCPPWGLSKFVYMDLQNYLNVPWPMEGYSLKLYILIVLKII